MALDASIYDNLTRPPAQPASPLAMMTGAADLKNALTRSQMAPLELQRIQEENAGLHQKNQTAAEDAADEKTLQGIYGDVQGDASIPPEKKLDELRSRAAGKVKPRTLENLSKQVEAHQTALQKLDDDKLKQLKAVSDEVGNTAQGILSADPAQQPALYATERERMIQSGLATPDHIPEQYDPEWLKVQAAHAMGASNAVTAENTRREQANKDADEKRKARTDELATAGQTIDGVQDQAGYDAWRSKLSPENKALTAATFSPQNVATIKRMALTANQQREADQATATAAETKRHNEAQEAAATAKPTYSGEMRAALVAVGADPEKATPAQAAAALDKLRPGEKPVDRNKLATIESDKAKALKDSKAKLDKDTAGATVGGKVLDQDAVDTAWEEHIQRLQDAQLAYEHELTTATGHDVGHNDWADRLRVPGKAGAAPSKPGAPAAAGAPAQARQGGVPKPQAAAPTATNAKGEKVQWNGSAWVPFKPAQP
jgi:hypothetical protein